MSDSPRNEELYRESSNSGTMQLLDRLGLGLVTIPPEGFGEESGTESEGKGLLIRRHIKNFETQGKFLVGSPSRVLRSG